MPDDATRADLRSELDRFLTEHPEVETVDAIHHDLCGIVRGKRYPRAALKTLFEDGLPIPYSLYFLDVTGACSDPRGRGFSDGDPDGISMPIPGTLVPVPWAERPAGQVLMTMNDDEGRPSIWDPRNVLRAVVERFAETGLTPCVAFELEFYLLDRERDAEGKPRAPIPPSTGARDNATQVYGVAQLDEHAAFFREVEQAAAAQKVPASIATAEYAPGQYEINLRHVTDPLRAADHCALFRNIVKRVAQRHGMRATFLSKPFPDQSGSGTHVHMSLLDASGDNAFDDGSALGSATLRHAVGGLAATMSEAMAFFVPNLNGFRRFGPNRFVPVSKSWGANNRSFAFRIPTGPGAARRIEHRVSGADANPYLVLAAILAGAHHGLTGRMDPGEPWRGNATESVDPDLPLDWVSAIDRLAGAEILRGYIDPDYLATYCATKRNEWHSFLAVISPREYDWYL